ncbi:uncharacterized protein LOC123037305 [Drosophila rhopaloa]|uniref:Uncharacterized protein n=1 Tax=Drosophila rhopaloa TaxID=1041015 RepID=A0ABM5J398_DRORH|nr:uncharacterized protein LOC123037305 [Drosophila rhopaloa]
MLALYLDEAEQNTWDELLPELSLTINSDISDTTGFSPAFIMQGREPRLPKTLFDQATPDHTSNQPPPGEKAEQMRELFRIVKDNSERASDEQRRHYNLRRREWRPPVGSLVLLRRHVLSKASEGYTAKLAAKYDGPYTVHKFLSPNPLQLQVPGSRRRRTVGLSDIKEYHDTDDDEHPDAIEKATS